MNVIHSRATTYRTYRLTVAREEQQHINAIEGPAVLCRGIPSPKLGMEKIGQGGLDMIAHLLHASLM